MELGKQLSNGPRGEDFNATTGRIFIAEKLLVGAESHRIAEIRETLAD